jgi:hypothetical protein
MKFSNVLAFAGLASATTLKEAVPATALAQVES